MLSKLPMVLWLAMCMCMIGAYVKWTDSNEAQYADVPVQIVFPQLENDADCSILIQDDVCIMIDTGEEQDYQVIATTLAEYNVSSIDYLILTHPDQDHMGSVIQLVDNIEVKQVIMPYYAKENELLDQVIACLEENKINIIYPTRTRKFSVGTMELLIYPPLERNYSDDNNYSLVTLIQHEQVSMLFAGDALRKRLEELELIHWSEIALLKIPYHGRANSKSKDFLELISPDIGVITSDTADEIIITTAEEQQTQLYYTGIETCTFESNGKQIVAVE